MRLLSKQPPSEKNAFVEVVMSDALQISTYSYTRVCGCLTRLLPVFGRFSFSFHFSFCFVGVSRQVIKSRP